MLNCIYTAGWQLTYSCRNYMVNNHWPRTGVTVPQVKGMYSKMRSSEMNGKQSTNPQQSNGQKTQS